MNKIKIFCSLLFLITAWPCDVSGQLKSPEIEAYSGGNTATGENAPFWFISGNHGIFSLQPHGAFAGISLLTTDSVKQFLDYNFGMEIRNRYDKNGYDLRFQQAYIEGRIWEVKIRAGRMEEFIGNQDSLFSMGGTVWSSNAPPMPKIAISSNGYVDVPLTRGWLQINAYLAHGWFENSRFVENLYMHHKYLHGKIGGDLMVNISYGLQHFGQWGGVSPVERFGKLPSDWDAFKRVFMAKSGESGTVDTNEIINRLGNHLGSRNYGIDVKLENATTGLYYQTIFEDNSGKNDKISRDGLWGLWLTFNNKNKIVNHLLYEYLNTTYQSGPVHKIGETVLGGNDNYFNNYLYPDGWTYHDYTLGTPMITSPIMKQGNRTIINNRVTAHHLGISGIIAGKISYKTFFTYSCNKGTYSLPFPNDKHQFSWYGETQIPLNKYKLFLDIALAADYGELHGENVGMMLQIRKIL